MNILAAMASIVFYLAFFFGCLYLIESEMERQQKRREEKASESSRKAYEIEKQARKEFEEAMNNLEDQ